MRTTTRGTVVLAAALLAGTIGCTEPQTHDSAPQEPSGASNAQETAETSRVKEYLTLAELKADSDRIVIGTVTDDGDTIDVSGMTFTRRVIHPAEIHAGEAPEPLMVMDFGASGLTGALEPGTTHLLFLAEYEISPGVPTGDYVVTGGPAGDYLQDADGSFIRTDHESPQLPERILADEGAQHLS